MIGPWPFRSKDILLGTQAQKKSRSQELPDNAHLPQPPLVGVLPGEGKLPVGEAVRSFSSS